MAIDSTRAVGCADAQGMAMRLGRYGRYTPTASPVGTGSAKTVLAISSAPEDGAALPDGAVNRRMPERTPTRERGDRVGARGRGGRLGGHGPRGGGQWGGGWG